MVVVAAMATAGVVEVVEIKTVAGAGVAEMADDEGRMGGGGGGARKACTMEEKASYRSMGVWLLLRLCVLAGCMTIADSTSLSNFAVSQCIVGSNGEWCMMPAFP
ncbi:hypothetical protein E2C01_082111 [Portunus trituberculatus]|uniref:Uncharacterized protein n=1 Tax=Portunus trituberculatus TaxID=210409 RepID=A0A5B7J421_PORTR|nr:hypothetical protein [Portunus trituberculatus]